MPLRDNRPVEGLKPYTAVKEAGQLIDPCVSLPKATGEKPAATATAEPPDEPHRGFKINQQLSPCQF